MCSLWSRRCRGTAPGPCRMTEKDCRRPAHMAWVATHLTPLTERQTANADRVDPSTQVQVEMGNDVDIGPSTIGGDENVIADQLTNPEFGRGVQVETSTGLNDFDDSGEFLCDGAEFAATVHIHHDHVGEHARITSKQILNGP